MCVSALMLILVQQERVAGNALSFAEIYEANNGADVTAIEQARAQHAAAVWAAIKQ
jgi:hypothetical protein